MAKLWQDRPLKLVFGMLESHDAEAFLKPMALLVAGAVTVAVPGEPSSRSAENAATAAAAAGIRAEPAPDVATAIRRVATGAPGRVLICGSLYLAGSVLAQNSTGADGTPVT
jgi:dihydrofolate synthase/folylpolyglutamate synthase